MKNTHMIEALFAVYVNGYRIGTIRTTYAYAMDLAADGLYVKKII